MAYLDFDGLSTYDGLIKAEISGKIDVGGKAGQIAYGAVDSTSTSTAFTATVDGVTELSDGTCVMLRNGVVTSAAGFTINVNGLGAKPVYNSLATGNGITPTNPTQDSTIFNINYTMLFVYVESDIVSGGCWMCFRGYDSNTNTIGYQLRTNSGNKVASDTGYRYRLWFTSADGSKWVPANTSTATDATTARSLNTRAIDPFGPIVYRATNGTCNANAGLGATGIWQQYTLSIGYSYMASGFSLTFPDSVYLKCTPNADGSATMNSIVQALPSSKDGKIYIHLGTAYSATNMELQTEHPVYWHDGTGIRIWTGAEPSGGSSVEPSSTTPSMDGTAAVGTATTYARADHVHPTDTSRANASAIEGALISSDAVSMWGLGGKTVLSAIEGAYTKANNKQDKLVSGTNIKTVNNESILGSGNITVSGSSPSIWYGTTASTASPFSVSCTGFTLTAGCIIRVEFYYAASLRKASSLNVNNTGDIAIFVDGSAVSAVNKFCWKAGDVITFIYDGTYWVYMNTNVIDHFDSGAIKSSSLPPATSSLLGAVKVGSGLSVAADGTLSLNVASASGVSF